MPYIKTAWVNGESEAVNATNLNKIETALKTSFDHTEKVTGAIHGSTDIGKELLRLITPSGVSVPAFTATGSVDLVEGISTSVVVTVSGGSATLTFQHGILTGIA